MSTAWEELMRELALERIAPTPTPPVPLPVRPVSPQEAEQHRADLLDALPVARCPHEEPRWRPRVLPGGRAAS